MQIELTDHFFQYTVKLTSILGFPVATVIFAQFLLNAPTVGLGINRILLGAIPCLIVELFLISLTSNIAISAIISSALWLLLATVNEYVFMFRGTEFMYSDFYGVRTAANVLGGYEFSIHNEIVVSWLALILFQTGILSFKFFPKSLRVKQRIVIAVLSVLLLVFLWFSTSNVSVERWGKEGSYINGYFLNFVTDLKNIFVAPPNNYSEQAIDALALEYNENDMVSTVSIDEYPDVVVIMSEAFTDFTVYGNNFNPREDVLSFYHSLNENTVKGYALSSVFGGKTANSEYEFLTGNSTAFLPEGSIPFMQYINKDTWTIASYFASLGYETIGMHPYLSNG